MPPILPTSMLEGLPAGRVLVHELKNIKPTRTLPNVVTRVLSARQQGTTTVVTTSTGGPTNNLSGGAIAGIVIGSIIGFLFLLWIIRSCINWRNPGAWGNTFEPDNEKPPHTHYYGGSTRYPREIHGHRHRSHSRHSHRSPRRTSVVSVTRPAYADRHRSRSPRAPPAAYYADGRDVRRSGDGRRYSRKY
ncbi:uncharacterized protein GGS22DRAFT_57637 [Annulohypoxylon maeteangense]|uniref:uncharacterized protein n=1 Tax=Annulohypoxylon maeteangense TaxID=1927788 RepID=UPI002007B09D|nr:uncharacterized protein GGS22DRAFT_57637 [Annulohypoxylon maeteangense]KAI0881409.1 hypothetical protein GGS22DRAFT_57637 [Annulohypoxylon maeteangense]